MSSARRLPPVRSLAVAGALGASALLLTACTNADTTRSSVAEAAQTESPSPTATDTQSASPTGSPTASMNEDKTERKDLVSKAKVTWDKAADTAVKEVPEGKLVDLELKRTDADATASPSGSPTGSASPSMPNPAPSEGAPEWEAKVAQSDGTLHRIDIDAVSGKVFRTMVDPDQDPDDKTQITEWLDKAKQTPQQAVKAATAKAKGTVTRVELGDNDDQQVVWDVDVVDKKSWDKTSVVVDAANGKVLSQKVDKD
ncbi:PepSY domain-containing protein [Streptomyces sp. NPDC058783]|uniref:PepSY domain-containing protein n=1 Tax=Streptomyces TaxID=1883 RepID=UPI00210F11BD|nr:PepSY domain-containing protein [Streptomyces coelicoflavus]MCQ4198471.1 PepSY domain-containing protein [Streptomyces coelicoflavus]